MKINDSLWFACNLSQWNASNHAADDRWSISRAVNEVTRRVSRTAGLQEAAAVAASRSSEASNRIVIAITSTSPGFVRALHSATSPEFFWSSLDCQVVVAPIAPDITPAILLQDVFQRFMQANHCSRFMQIPCPLATTDRLTPYLFWLYFAYFFVGFYFFTGLCQLVWSWSMTPLCVLVIARGPGCLLMAGGCGTMGY